MSRSAVAIWIRWQAMAARLGVSVDALLGMKLIEANRRAEP